jgi:hypothetical protein
MNAHTQVRKALKSHTACFSIKGHDFCCCGNRRYVKRVTRRANRALSKALIHEEA